MPIKKRLDTEVKVETKHCPFCDNEIKMKAIKCQYCWEFLEEWHNEGHTEPQIDIWNSIKASALYTWKAVFRWYVWISIWLWISFLAWIFAWDFTENDTFHTIDVLISFVPIILLMIWSNKTYKYLLNKKEKNLRFNSISWPTRWWICPIACFYIPFQTVKDIYKTFNKKTWIIWWRWACYLITSILLRVVNKGLDDSWFIALLALWFLVIEYILVFNIIINVNNSLESQE